MLSYHPQPRTYQSQAGSVVAGQNKWRSTLASLCSLGILCENYTVFPWSSTGLTSFVQGWSGFQVLFSCACRWWCDFSYFKLKPRQLIIKCDSLWGFAAFSFLPHIERQDRCCIQLVALHISPCNYIFPYHLASFDPFLTRSVPPESCQDSSRKPWPGTWQALRGCWSTWPHVQTWPCRKVGFSKVNSSSGGAGNHFVGLNKPAYFSLPC